MGRGERVPGGSQEGRLYLRDTLLPGKELPLLLVSNQSDLAVTVLGDDGALNGGCNGDKL